MKKTLKLTNNSNEKFSLKINNKLYYFEKVWCSNGYWNFHIYDVENEKIINGIKVVPNIDLLGQFEFFGFSLICNFKKKPSRFELPDCLFEIEVFQNDAQ